MKHLCVLILCASLCSACAFMEPSAESRFLAKPGTPTELVFACAETTIGSLQKQRGGWSAVVTRRDRGSGLFETDRFEEVNVIGIRTQVRYKPEAGVGRVRIKASGPYFSDMGADLAAVQLAGGIKQCL